MPYRWMEAFLEQSPDNLKSKNVSKKKQDLSAKQHFYKQTKDRLDA